jgi:hypothetical protein
MGKGQSGEGGSAGLNESNFDESAVLHGTALFHWHQLPGLKHRITPV